MKLVAYCRTLLLFLQYIALFVKELLDAKDQYNL